MQVAVVGSGLAGFTAYQTLRRELESDSQGARHLAAGDARMRAEHFAILVIGVPRTLALLVGREPPAEEERRLRAAVRLFLDGARCRSTG